MRLKKEKKEKDESNYRALVRSKHGSPIPSVARRNLWLRINLVMLKWRISPSTFFFSAITRIINMMFQRHFACVVSFQHTSGSILDLIDDAAIYLHRSARIRSWRSLVNAEIEAIYGKATLQQEHELIWHLNCTLSNS